MRKALVCWILLLSVTHSYAQPRIGKPAPPLVIPGVNNFSLSGLKGKVVLVDFWASWCKPCRYSNRYLVPVYQQYGAAGFEIVGISLDHDSLAWQNAIRTDKIQWLQFNEKRGWNTATTRAWGIRLLPTSFLVDKKGVIVSIDPSTAELQHYLQQALK